MKSVYIDCSEFARSVLTPAILEKLPGLVVHVGDPDREALTSMLTGAVGVLNGHTIMDATLLEGCKDLRTIVFLGTGASSYIDLAAAKRLRIDVRTVRGYGDRTIAEHAFALILAGARGIAKMDREIRRGEWNASAGTELSGKRLGVIGTGGTGRQLIKMADAFGMEVVAWNRSGVPVDLPCKELALGELLETSQVVSLHLALNGDTRALLDRKRLETLRPDAILVNVARGELVDEPALVDLLRRGRIAHAALDVFAREPLPKDHPLVALENVTLTSHAAFKSNEAMTRLLSDGFDLLRNALCKLEATSIGQIRGGSGR